MSKSKVDIPKQNYFPLTLNQGNVSGTTAKSMFGDDFPHIFVTKHAISSVEIFTSAYYNSSSVAQFTLYSLLIEKCTILGE